MDQMLIERLIETLNDLKKTLEAMRGDASEEPELKPCPFCGGEAVGMCGGVQQYVRCYCCNTEGPTCDTKQEAIEAWNRRVYEKADT